MVDLAPAVEGLRTHDIQQGLRNVDRTSGLLVRELMTTQLVGMAAALAGWVKGLDVIENAQALQVLAADQLHVDPFAFDKVVGLLEELDMVRQVERQAGGIVSFYESVPPTFDSLYSLLGATWREQNPTEIEQSLVKAVDTLSRGPAAVAALDIDPGALGRVLEVGMASEAIQVVPARGGDIAYSPFFAYERPEEVGRVLAEVDLEKVAATFSTVRAFQGLPLTLSKDGDTLSALVGAGLMAGPSLERPDGSTETFAIAPYGFSSDVFTINKPLLEKALAILAAVRMGEHFGGITALHSPQALLHALLQPERVVAWHSSTTRQYAVLNRMGIVRFTTLGSRSGIQLIDTDDNKTAVRIAIDLLDLGEAVATKEIYLPDERVLLTAGTYRSPIQAIRQARRRAAMPDEEVREIVELAMGWQAP